VGELDDFYEELTGIRPSEDDASMTETELEMLCAIIAGIILEE
jgi:hypothetical protein